MTTNIHKQAAEKLREFYTALDTIDPGLCRQVKKYTGARLHRVCHSRELYNRARTWRNLLLVASRGPDLHIHSARIDRALEKLKAMDDFMGNGERHDQ